MAERHNAYATDISRVLNNYTELSVLLAKYGQQDAVRLCGYRVQRGPL